jgi:hypothetical protein
MGHTEDVRAISLVMGSTGFLCSCTTLLLINSLRKKNGYILLLSTMTAFQIVYDLNYALRFLTSDDACFTTQFLDLVGGLGASFWSNILTFSVTYTIICCRSIKVFQHYPLFSLVGTVVPITVGILAMTLPVIDVDDDSYGCSYQETPEAKAIGNIYYWGRLVSVFFTAMLCAYNFFRLQELTNYRENNMEIKTARQHDLFSMYRTIYRMNFYALAQIISRSGAAWNEWDYGAYSSNSSSTMAAFCSPSMGIWNFIIFMVNDCY